MISYLTIKKYFDIDYPYSNEYGIGGAEIKRMIRPLGGNYKNIEIIEKEINEIIHYCCPEKHYKIIYQNHKAHELVKCFKQSWTEFDEVSYTDLDIIDFLYKGGKNTVCFNEYGSGEEFLNNSKEHIDSIQYQLNHLYEMLEKKYDWINLKKKIELNKRLEKNVLNNNNNHNKKSINKIKV